MSKSDKLGFKILGLVGAVALIHRFWGLSTAFWVAVVIVAVAFWRLYEDRL